MRENKMKLWCEALAIVAAIFLVNHSAAGDSKEVTFTGKVVNTESGPIAGARVTLYQITYDNEGNTAESKLTGETRTASDGVFSFKAVVEGDSYLNAYIVAEKEELALGWADWQMRDNQQQDIMLGEPKQLGGMIVDEDGKPVSNADVSIWVIAAGEGQDQQKLGRPVAAQLLTVATDASGQFTFTNIPAEATADFIIRKPGRATLRTYRSTGYANQELTFAPGQADIKLVLSAEARIQGTVVAKDTGNPVAGAKLMVETQENRPLFGQESVISGDDGTFRIDALAAGNYLVQLVRPQEGPADWVAEPVSVTLEEGQTKTDVRIEQSKGGLLEVSIAEAKTNKPLGKASVSIRDQRNNRWLSAKSDEDGIARIRLTPGGYQISGVFKQGYMPDRPQETITIEEGSTKRVARTLAEMPKISGVVRDTAGNPIEGVRLITLPGGREPVISDSQGKFEYIWDRGSWGHREDTVFCFVARHEQRNLATALEIGDDTKTLDLKLEPGITFAGKVVDPGGKGIPGTLIRPMLRLSNWGAPLNREQVKADDDGNYEIRAIPPGHNYKIYASAKGYGEKDVTVDVDNASNNRLSIETMTLPLANLSISGQIVDTEGNPMPDARISGYGEDQPHSNTLSDIQGNFTLDGLCEGKVYVRVDVRRGGKLLSARVHTDAGAAGVKIPIREGRAVPYYIAGKTDEEIVRGNERAIAGVALDERGSPVAGVPVSVCCHQRKKEDGRSVWHYTTFIGLSDITDERGRFAIAIKEDGKYNLRFSPDNQAAMVVYDIPTGKTDLKVTLPDGGTLAGRLMRMVRGERVPVPNAEVKIQQTSRASYTHLGFDRDRTTLTDAQGRFRFEHLRTKIRPSGSRSDEQWSPVPRVWEVSYGPTLKTVAFYDGTLIEDFELIVRPDPTQAGPLLGAALPGFDDIKIDIPADFATGRMVLVCFFDMNQRPSRNCVAQLNKRAQELKANGVAVVIVQAAKVDANALRAWAEKTGIAFPVGTIQIDPEETKSQWAIKGLPWLVLADRKHIVAAEGFGVRELGEKTDQINSGK